MNDNFNYEVKKILKNAEKECMNLKHPYVGTEHLLLSLLKNKDVLEVASHYGLTYEIFRDELINIVGLSNKKSEVILYTPLLRMVIEMSTKEENVTAKNIMKNLLSSDDGIALRLLMGLNIDIESMYKELSEDDISELSVIGEQIKSDNILIGRDKEINEIIQILLRKNKNNPILIGEAGVGKSAIVEELSRRIDANLVPPKLKGKKIISLDMASMLSNTKYRGEFETRLNNIIKEVKKNKNIILFIDEIHTIVKTGGGEGSIDAANILKPYLANDKIKIIGATTTYEYEKFISPDKALKRRFQSVMVVEPNELETKNILLGVKKIYEDFHNVKITESNIDYIVSLANKYIYTNHNPDKSLDVLDMVASKVNMESELQENSFKCNEYLNNKDYKNAYYIRKNNKKKLTIKNKDIEETIMSITGINLIKQKDIDNLSHILNTKFGINKMNRIFENRLNSNKVLSFTLKGKDKNIKEEIVNTIVSTLKYNYLELDLKDYVSDTSINRIVGSDPGYIGYNDVNLLSKIKYKPYSLIYLKNADASSYKVLELFKSIIDKSYIRDNKNELVVFDNCVIIMDKLKETPIVGYEHHEENTNFEVDTDLIITNA
jgi:negative regulator of genetic competence ClpC/MecB